MTTTLLASFPSPSQGVWHLGPIPIRAYALFILVGVIAALIIGNKRWVARGGEPGVIYDIALWAIILGLVGGRLYHVLTDWTTYFGPGGAGLVAAFKIQEGGLGIWGAVALGGVGAWIGCRRRGIPLPAFGDAIAPGIVLAQAIGRIGNYFNQELYGRPTTMPWGLEIYERRDAHGALDSLNGVSTGQLLEIVHPTFLYELLWNLVVFAFLIWVDRRYRIGHGRLFALYVAAYCFGRFWVELMRNDMATHIAGIRINSFVSVFVFIGAVVYIMVAPKGREDPSDLRGDVEAQELAPDEEETPTEQFTKELAAVAATTGVVAAAKVAGDTADDKEDQQTSEATSDVPDTSEHDADTTGEGEAEPVAEAEQLAEDVETAPSEDIAEAEAFAEAGEKAESEGAETAAVGGLGAVEGDEVTEAEEAAPEVHEAAVENADDAAEVADGASAEATVENADDDEAAVETGSVEGDEIAEPDDEAPADADAEPAPEQPDDEQSDDEAREETAAVGGLGAVEGDEVTEAEEAAPEVHEAAVENADDAAEVADEASAEATVENADGEAASDGEAAAETDVEQPTGEAASDQPAEAEATEAAEVDDIAEPGEAPADVDTEDAAEAAAETDGEQPADETRDETVAVGGLGAVEGDEVTEAEQAAPEVHEAAVENADEAAEAAGDASDEPDDNEESAAADDAGDGVAVPAGEQAEPDARPTPVTDTSAAADTSTDDSTATARLRNRLSRRFRRR